jgi:hypothetical protein
MSDEEEAGSDKVTASTRAFEEIDAQVFPGPGRGATQSEAAASDRWGAPSANMVEAYRRMFDVVAKHQRAQSERRASITAERRSRGVQLATSCTTDHRQQMKNEEEHANTETGESTCLTAPTKATARAQ